MADVNGKPRSSTHALEWPIDLDGVTISEITLRRLTGGEVAVLQDAMLGKDASDADMIAAFADQPAEVIAALDADDFMDLKDLVVDFLPRKIRAALEAVLKDAALEAEPETPAAD